MFSDPIKDLGQFSRSSRTEVKISGWSISWWDRSFTRYGRKPGDFGWGIKTTGIDKILDEGMKLSVGSWTFEPESEIESQMAFSIWKDLQKGQWFTLLIFYSTTSTKPQVWNEVFQSCDFIYLRLHYFVHQIHALNFFSDPLSSRSLLSSTFPLDAQPEPHSPLAIYVTKAISDRTYTEGETPTQACQLGHKSIRERHSAFLFSTVLHFLDPHPSLDFVLDPVPHEEHTVLVSADSTLSNCPL